MTVFNSLTVSDVIRETSDAISVEFQVPESLKPDYAYTQGQHLTLKADIDGEEVRRSYSICSSVGEKKLKVAIKQIDGGKFSSFANTMLKAGDTIDVMVPQGRFFTDLDSANEKSYLLIAAGSGITPIISILKSALEAEPESTVTLIYGNRSVSSILFLEELEDLKNRYKERLSLIYILSREPQDSEIFNGRITAEKCDELFKGPLSNSKFDEAFLCGPEEMIMSCRDFLKSSGLDASNIHFELFITDAAIAAEKSSQAKTSVAKGPEHSVQVIMDGRTTEIKIPEEGVSILDAALAANMDVPFACKGGVCCTCRAKVLQGEVRMDINYALEDDEVEDGYVLTCQSHPLSDDVIVDFDQQ
ncbi:1,2-phenylacetyl-CoA epoxidase subunit PaaE [Sneathiella limimaris]|uniref:1,2-phenylacetyl-CoA epoxidase subunit PaaE n=1 Tax=Sneathiella limimaris TaxID=1964213 RepID=UPI00146A9408|nr:1,2-phenylacetyl-CoA epoxidase subunit PaaE [Sneathiella limimaris]